MVYTKHMARKSKKAAPLNFKKNLRNTKIITPAAALIIFAVVAIAIAWPARKENSSERTPIFRNGEIVTVEGTYVCLPHKDTTGPQTDECALGIKTDDNRYYGLQVLSDGYDALSGLSSGDRLEARGTFQKRDSIYQSSGVIITDTLKPIKE